MLLGKKVIIFPFNLHFKNESLLQMQLTIRVKMQNIVFN